MLVVHVCSLVVRLNSGHNELDACRPDLQKILKTEEKMCSCHRLLAWQETQWVPPHPPCFFSLILNNNDNNGFPIVGNEATGKLFALIFPWRGTCVVNKEDECSRSPSRVWSACGCVTLLASCITTWTRPLPVRSAFFLLIDGFTLRTVKVSQEAVLSSFTLLFFFFFVDTRSEFLQEANLFTSAELMEAHLIAFYIFRSVPDIIPVRHQFIWLSTSCMWDISPAIRKLRRRSPVFSWQSDHIRRQDYPREFPPHARRKHFKPHRGEGKRLDCSFPQSQTEEFNLLVLLIKSFGKLQAGCVLAQFGRKYPIFPYSS